MIVPMKKAHIVVLKEDRDKLLKSLQKKEVLMLIKTGDENLHVDVKDEDQLIQRAENSLNLIKKFRKKPGFVKEEFIVDYETFSSDNPRRSELINLIEDRTNAIKELEIRNESLHNENKFYLPWESLDLKLSEIKDPKYAIIHFGFIESRNLLKFNEILNNFGADSKFLDAHSNSNSVMFASFIEDDKQLLDQLKTVGFNEVSFENLDLYPKDILVANREEISSNNHEISNLLLELEQFAEEVKEIEVLADQAIATKELKQAPVYETYSATYIEGWVRSDQIDILEKAVKKAVEIYDLQLNDPDEDDVVPTATKSGKFASSFESITNMFSVPSQNDVDPNPVMGLWYWIIFGMMMGDAGYGLLMAIIFFVLIKVKKPKGSTLKLYRVLMYSSIPTIIWGVLFSSYFGYSLHDPILLNPQVDILKYLIVTLIVGALHLISGYLVKAYQLIKQGKLIDAIFDCFAWIFLIVGLGLLFVPGLDLVGKALAITGAAIIVLTHGRDKKNIFAKLGGGLYSLYNSVGVASDILSYSRILALSLSSAIIGMVMNTLAEMLQGNLIGIFFSVIVYILGHVFNLVMGLLSAYVHDSRLQYIEFFGKFYEGGGVEFKPLSMNLKYIDEIEKVEI